MNYSTTPEYSVLPWIAPETRWLFDVALILFAVVFFVGIYYRMHVLQHLVPPFFIMWLLDRWQRWRHK